MGAKLAPIVPLEGYPTPLGHPKVQLGAKLAPTLHIWPEGMVDTSNRS